MKINLLLLFSILVNVIIAQVCRPGFAEQSVRFGAYTNNLRTGGDLFWDGSNSRMGVLNADNSVTPLLFAGGIWMGGKTPSGDLRVSGVTYRSLTDNFDFYPGPLNQLGETQEGDCKNWDKIFSVRKIEIKEALELIYNGQSTPSNSNCEKLPLAILSWPARGNPYFADYYGFELPDQELASFFDYDLDGKYDPCKGDIPALTTDNCDFNSVYEVLSSFPSQLYFNVFNDNGGVSRLTAGDALQMEVHSYFFTFDNKEGEDMSFLKYKTLYKGDIPLDSFYFAMWLDPDLGCYQDDYIGTASAEDLVFVYNQDAIDGNIGSDCSGGISTFGDKIPMVGISYMQGLKKADGTDTRLSSSWMTDNCAIGSPDLPCDPYGNDLSFYIGLKSNGFNFDGNPANPNELSMCKSNLFSGDRRVLVNTGGGSMLQPGDTKEVILAITVAKNVPHPCPDSKYIIDKNREARNLYEHCWQNVDGPDAPTVVATSKDAKVNLAFDNNIIGHNNKALSYSAVINNLVGVTDNKYKFEGYKVYQVNSKDYDLTKLGDSNSVEVITLDIANGIDSVFNWETVIADNGTRSVVKKLKAVGINNGVPDNIEIDYDYINQLPLQVNRTYHYVVVAYGYNNYKNYDQATNVGQATQFITSIQNASVVSIKPKFGDNALTAKIKRISGRGNYNFIKVDDATRKNMLSNTFDGTIEYLIGHGPFDIKILDSTKVKGKTYRIEIEGPIDNNTKVCNFIADQTYYTVTDIASGASYKSQQPISHSYEETFELLGIAISIFQPTESNSAKNLDDLFIGEQINYSDENKVKWFGSLADRPAQYNPVEYALDPITVTIDGSNEVPAITKGSFQPLYFSKYQQNDGIPFVTATSLEAMPLVVDPNSGTLKLRDLNNVDIVFTSDKSKWSRCIVVETATSFYPLSNSGFINKTLEVKSNNSVDKNGNKETQSTGMSWFPGYAIDVVTGKRVNIFFGENTALSKSDKSLQNPSIADDMLFNPSDEVISNTNFESADEFLYNFPVGGGHCIYVTRQDYDECAQLSVRLKKGTSAFGKRDPLGAVTWSAIPVLQSNTQLLSYPEGVIPNDLTIMLRVNNHFFNENMLTDIATFKTCNYENANPVYQIGFEQASNTTENIFIPSWHLKSNFSGFSMNALDDDVMVEVSDLSGKIISKQKVAANNYLEWLASDRDINNSVIFIKITEVKSSKSRVYKAVMMW